jgi:hypothetical protein
MKKLEQLTTKLILVIIGLTAGSALLVPATYASFHPVTTGEIADNTIRSADISNTAGVQSVDIVNGQVGSVDIGTGQVASVDIGDGQVTTADLARDAIRLNVQQVAGEAGEGFASVSCPDGTVVVGGGGSTRVTSAISHSVPNEDGSGWQVGTVDPTIPIVAVAVCLDTSIP